MRYRDAYDALTECGIPRRKYSPQHWLTEVYFAGRRVGGWWVRATRNPLVIFIRGIRDSQEWK